MRYHVPLLLDHPFWKHLLTPSSTNSMQLTSFLVSTHSYNNVTSFFQFSTQLTLPQSTFLSANALTSFSQTYWRFQLRDSQPKTLSMPVLWHQHKGWRKALQRLSTPCLFERIPLEARNWSGGQAKVLSTPFLTCRYWISFKTSVLHRYGWSLTSSQNMGCSQNHSPMLSGSNHYKHRILNTKCTRLHIQAASTAGTLQ